MKNSLRNKLIHTVIILLSCSILFAQNDYFSAQSVLRFADHLYDQQDFSRAAGEYLRYQYLISGKSDSINFKLADCYARIEKFENSNKYLEVISASSTDQFSLQKSYYQISKNDFLQKKFKKIIESEIPAVEDHFHDDLIFLHTYSLIYQRDWSGTNLLLEKHQIAKPENLQTFENLQNYCMQGATLKTKSPFFAGSLSAVIPGMGKIYTERTKDAFTSFVTTGVFGYLAYRNYQEDGVKSLRFNIYAGLSLVFYLSNIYGSVISAKHYNHDIVNDYLQKLDVKLQ